MAHIELVSGAQLTNKNVEESHMMPKKYLGTELGKLLTIWLIRATLVTAQKMKFSVYRRNP